VRKVIRACLLFLAATVQVSWGGTISPLSVRKLEAPASSVAWLDSQHVVVAGPSGIRALSLRDWKSVEMISVQPLPEGLPDPLSVTTDGKSVVASNGFLRTQFACAADSRKRLFAHSSPSFVVIDLAVSAGKLYVLGWPVGPTAANNPDGIAVWQGAVSPRFEKFQPLHRIQSGSASVAIFNDSLPIYGGALAVEPDGTLDVITAAEAGVFQYTVDGALRRRLGSGLGELVMRRMHDVNFTYGGEPLARYQQVVNRQSTIDDLVVTPDGPAIVVRTVKDDLVGWELWYPDEHRISRRVKLGISRRGPFGHLSCDTRKRDLVCVYQAPASSQQATGIDQSNLSTFLVRFELPPASVPQPTVPSR
jgi:hypothetical protein